MPEDIKRAHGQLIERMFRIRGSYGRVPVTTGTLCAPALVILHNRLLASLPDGIRQPPL